MISGSGRAGSTSTAVVRTAAELAPPEVRPDTFDGLGELPLFNPDADLEGAAVDNRVTLLRRPVARADAVPICTSSVRIPVSRADLRTDGLIESVDIRREVAAAVERLAGLIGSGSRTKP